MVVVIVVVAALQVLGGAAMLAEAPTITQQIAGILTLSNGFTLGALAAVVSGLGKVRRAAERNDESADLCAQHLGRLAARADQLAARLGLPEDPLAPAARPQPRE